MMDAYIDFLEKLFPAIDPYTASRAKDAVKEFSRYGRKGCFLTFPAGDDFQQGDIFSGVLFCFVADDGQVRIMVSYGILLNNTCDAVRSDRLQFAAMSSFKDYSQDSAILDAVKSNINYDYLYFPDQKVDDKFVNFNLIGSVSRDAFQKSIKVGKTERVASLNLAGYFLFLTKLTVYLMRPEDTEVYASRKND